MTSKHAAMYNRGVVLVSRASSRLERHMFLFTISMYIYVIARPENMEHVLETATAGDEARRDANELRLCRRKFFHSTGKD